MGEERHSRIRKYVENKPQRLKLLCRRLFFFLTFHVAGGGRCCLRAIVTLGLLFLSCRIVLEHYFLQFMRYTFFFFTLLFPSFPSSQFDTELPQTQWLKTIPVYWLSVYRSEVWHSVSRFSGAGCSKCRKAEIKVSDSLFSSLAHGSLSSSFLSLVQISSSWL